MSDHDLDARGMLCPMPVIKTQNKIKELNTGDILNVISTDSGALIDIPAWARINGHEVIETLDENQEITIKVRVGE